MRGVLDKDLVQIEIDQPLLMGWELCAHSRSKITAMHPVRSWCCPRKIIRPESFMNIDKGFRSVSIIMGME